MIMLFLKSVESVGIGRISLKVNNGFSLSFFFFNSFLLFFFDEFGSDLLDFMESLNHGKRDSIDLDNEKNTIRIG